MPRALLAAGLVAWGITDWAADKLLHPVRWTLADTRKQGHPTSPPEVGLAFEALSLARPDKTVQIGWLIRGKKPSRGLLVWLHRFSDNRASALWIAPRFAALGFDVLAFDARAHGESGGEEYTYGFREKDDLVAQIALVAAQKGVRGDRVVLLGASVGGAVAVQAAPAIPGLRSVVAVAPFESLAAMATARKPWYVTEAMALRSLVEAGALGGFKVSEVSPLAAAPRLKVPLLVLAGGEDDKVPPEQGRRVAQAAPAGRFVLVDGADHDDLLSRAEPWAEIERFVLETTR